MAEKKVGRSRFRSIRNRRKMGLTFVNTIRILKDLKKENALDPEMTNDEIAALVLDRAMSENPRAFEKVTAIDWDNLLAFIERLLPIILQIIALF